MTVKSLLCTTALSIAIVGSSGPVLAAPAMAPSGEETAARGTAFQVPLDRVTNPKGRLAKATVEDKIGNSVGAVHDVVVDHDGRPTAVRVNVGGFLGMGTKLIELRATELKYEQDRNVLITKLRKPQIEAMPAINA